MSDVNELLITPLQKFSKDSMHLIKRCTKPDRKGEFWDVTVKTLQRKPVCSGTVYTHRTDTTAQGRVQQQYAAVTTYSAVASHPVLRAHFPNPHTTAAKPGRGVKYDWMEYSFRLSTRDGVFWDKMEPYSPHVPHTRVVGIGRGASAVAIMLVQI